MSRSLKALAELGYIEAAQNPYKRRQRAYRVLYAPDDKAIMKAAIGSEIVTEDEPTEDPIGNNPVPDCQPIGNKDFYEPERSQWVPDHKISCETVIYPAEAEDSSPEGVLGNEEEESTLESYVLREGEPRRFTAVIGGRP